MVHISGITVHHSRDVQLHSRIIALDPSDEGTPRRHICHEVHVYEGTHIIIFLFLNAFLIINERI